MNQRAIAALVFVFLTWLVSGIAVAADSPVSVETEVAVVQNPAANEWVPPGFESLNEPQVTEIDLYYGDQFLTAVFARFTQTELSFLNTDAITQLLQNLSDPESVNLILQKPFATNAHALCHSDFQVDCGKLSPETVDIIFDRAVLRADLFINPELLLAGQPLQNRFLPESSAEFSLFTDNAVMFSGVDDEQTTYNFVNTTRIALAESRLMLRSNVTDTQGISVDTLAWQKEFQGKDYQIGLFRGNASNFRFMGSEQFIGASMASSVLTRVDLDQSLGTEIELFFGSRSRIEILRDDRLLASGYYDVGNQIIDTSMLPPGSYEIEIRIVDSSGAMTTEYRFFSKTSKLPPEDQAIYFLQAGKLTDQGIGGGFPQQGVSVVRGGYSKRLSPSLGADLGFSTTPDSTVYEAGLFKMGESYEIKAEVAVEDNGATGADLNVRWDLDFIRLNLSSRKVWEGDSVLQLGDGLSQSSVSLDMPSRWGSFGVFARSNKRDMGIDSTNYGLRWQASSYSIGGGNLSAGLELSKNDDDVLAMFTLSYRLNGRTSQHSFSPGLSYESFASDNLSRTRFLGSHLSTWAYGDDEARRLTLRADHDEESSFEARYEDRHRIGDSDLRARFNAGSQQLEYSGQLSSSFAYTPMATGFGGRPRGDSAFIVKVDGVPDEAEFEVMINGSARGRTFAGKRLLVPVMPYETYKVELNPLGDTIIDLDDKTYQKTVYPGNVVALNWSARIIKIIIGRIVDESGVAIEGALIRNVKGFGVTEEEGFFQAEVEQDTKSLIIQKGIKVCEAEFDFGDTEKKVASLGTLTCVEIDDPIVQFLTDPSDPGVAAQETPAADALKAAPAAVELAPEVVTNINPDPAPFVAQRAIDTNNAVTAAQADTDLSQLVVLSSADASAFNAGGGQLTQVAAIAAVATEPGSVATSPAVSMRDSAATAPSSYRQHGLQPGLVEQLGNVNAALVDEYTYSIKINEIPLKYKLNTETVLLAWIRPAFADQGGESGLASTVDRPAFDRAAFTGIENSYAELPQHLALVANPVPPASAVLSPAPGNKFIEEIIDNKYNKLSIYSNLDSVIRPTSPVPCGASRMACGFAPWLLAAGAGTSGNPGVAGVRLWPGFEHRQGAPPGKASGLAATWCPLAGSRSVIRAGCGPPGVFEGWDSGSDLAANDAERWMRWKQHPPARWGLSSS